MCLSKRNPDTRENPRVNSGSINYKSIYNLILALFFSGFTLAQAPSHPIEYDPNTGRPLLVQGLTGDAWEIPVEVYSDSNLEIFTSGSYLVSSVQGGYGKSGQWDVRLYSHFKSDVLCKKFLQSQQIKGNDQEIERECHLIRYKAMRLTVNTHSKTVIVTGRAAFDSHGNYLASQPNDHEWRLIASLFTSSDDCSVKTCRDPESPYLRVVIGHITSLIDREEEYFLKAP
jgi:WD40 repeat protein